MHTFAGQVEQALTVNFGAEHVDRVLHCWRRLEANVEYQQPVVLQDDDNDKKDRLDTTTSRVDDDDPIPVTRTTEDLRVQQCHSHVPGLTVQEFWKDATTSTTTTTRPDMAWAIELQSKFGAAICQEFTNVMERNAQTLSEEGNNVWSAALTEEAAANYGRGWKTLVLMDRGVWDETNVQFFPQTARAIHEAGVPAVEVFFARMDPWATIPTHSDQTNFVLTSHLGIQIPSTTTTTTTSPNDDKDMDDNDNNKDTVRRRYCELRVGNQVEAWQAGHVMVFDTSLQHNAVNWTPEPRTILMMRVWHPELTTIEKQALQFIWDCLDVPELATTSVHGPPDQTQALLQQAKERRAVPQVVLDTLTTTIDLKSSMGFGGTTNRRTTQKKKGRKKK